MNMDLVRNIKRVMDRKGILVLYPEARYANVGTSSLLPGSTGKLCKILNVPVVTINMKGNYLHSPIWNLRYRKGVKFDAVIKQVFTAQEIQEVSRDEIQRTLQKELSFDEYRWQKEAGILITENLPEPASPSTQNMITETKDSVSPCPQKTILILFFLQQRPLM